MMYLFSNVLNYIKIVILYTYICSIDKFSLIVNSFNDEKLRENKFSAWEECPA